MKQTDNLIAEYRRAQKTLPVKDSSSSFSNLVTATNTDQFPVQRWFHFKEAFSLELLEKLLSKHQISSTNVTRILDPFCGSGTTMLAAQKFAKTSGRTDLTAIGLERNPFLHFVASTKDKWHQLSSIEVENAAAYLLNGAPKGSAHRLPNLSTLKRKDVFERHTLRRLLGFKGAIETLDDRIKPMMLLGLASIIEEVSGVRKDGRALRLVKKLDVPSVDLAVTEAWRRIKFDLDTAAKFYLPIESKVLIGDGRTIAPDSGIDIAGAGFDLVLYSPPYLNNIDYTEVYKMELWLSGFVDSPEEFRKLRFRTLRSHPSVKFPDPVAMTELEDCRSANRIIDALIDALPDDAQKNWRSRLFRAYFDDLHVSLRNQYRVLDVGGWAFCVVGNSVHGSSDSAGVRVPVASDIVIATLAETVGFEVRAVHVARQLKRRMPGNEFARESIIALHKPREDKG